MQKNDATLSQGDKGEYKRVESGFRQFVSSDHPVFKPQAGRYHLYVSYACPWAHRTLILRKLKGLEDAISISVVHPTWAKTRENEEHLGWILKDPNDPPVTNQLGFGSFSCEDCIPDPNCNAKTIRDLYEMSKDTIGKYSVPVLFDK